MLKNVYEGLNARPKVYLSKEYFCEMYPTCASSKLCEFIVVSVVVKFCHFQLGHLVRCNTQWDSAFKLKLENISCMVNVIFMHNKKYLFLSVPRQPIRFKCPSLTQ